MVLIGRVISYSMRVEKELSINMKTKANKQNMNQIFEEISQKMIVEFSNKK